MASRIQMLLTRYKRNSLLYESLFMLAFPPVVILIFLLYGCTDKQPANLNVPLALFSENKLEQALPLLEQAVAEHQKDTDSHVWLAETYRRLGEKDKAVKTAEMALRLDPCNSFAHTVIADASRMPAQIGRSDSDSNWIHLNSAIQCDSTDGNAWVSIWNETILREKFGMMHKAVLKMEETGFLTRAALAYGRWMLLTLPENAILITNGDMDTFPPLVLQEVEGFRQDVVVAERGLLGTRQFLHFIRDNSGVPLPVQDSVIDSLTDYKTMSESILSVSDKIFKGWIDMKANGLFQRPIAIAVTVAESYYFNVGDHFRYSGPFLLWQPTPANEKPDTTLIRESLAGIQAEDFTGSWISEQDRSPVRRLYTKDIIKNVTLAALAYGNEMIKSENFTEAKRILRWAEEFEKKTELGPVFTLQISQLKEAAETKDTRK
jgi:tetratricopeptide (TPR) repeat protein